MTDESRYERYCAFCIIVEVEPMTFEKWAQVADGLDHGFAQRKVEYINRNCD